MYKIKLNFFINNKYERLEIWITKKQLEGILGFRNNPELSDKLVTVEGSGIWFAPKDILFIEELDETSAWWQSQAPQYYCENLEKENEESIGTNWPG